jgi:hypothetical protein
VQDRVLWLQRQSDPRFCCHHNEDDEEGEQSGKAGELWRRHQRQRWWLWSATGKLKRLDLASASVCMLLRAFGVTK